MFIGVAITGVQISLIRAASVMVQQSAPSISMPRKIRKLVTEKKKERMDSIGESR